MRGHGQDQAERARLTGRTALAVAAVCALIGAWGCGGSDEDGGDESRELGPIPATPRAIAEARSAVDRYCAQVARYLNGRREPPTTAEYERVGRALDRLAERAKLTPTETAPDGSTARLALGDLAENLEGTNCDSRLVVRIDEALIELPAG